MLYFNWKVPSVGVVHDGLHVVAGEEAGGAVAHAFEPAVVVLFDDVNDRALHESQLVVLVLGVVVDGHHCEQEGKRFALGLCTQRQDFACKYLETLSKPFSM